MAGEENPDITAANCAKPEKKAQMGLCAQIRTGDREAEKGGQGTPEVWEWSERLAQDNCLSCPWG